LSFIDSLRLICDAIPGFQLVDPTHHSRLWQRLLADIATRRLPPRDNRINPRVVKRKMSKFKKKRTKLLRPPRPQSFRHGLVILGHSHAA
jgi:hypothetical protein